MRLGKRQLQELLFYMVLTRKLEESLARLHREQELQSPLGLRSGLEAVSVGAAFVPTPGDALASSLPTIGSLLLRGVKPAEIVLQFLGRAGSPSGGRDGIRHFGDLARGIVGTAGHTSAHVGVMAGVAYAALLKRQERVAIALVSEEAVASGDFHEGINFAAVRKVPLVVVVVRFPAPASGPASGRATGSEVAQLYERVRGYGIRALPVDGSDLLQVVHVVETATDRAKSGEGPTLIEAPIRSSTRYFGNDDATPAPFGEAARMDPLQSENESDVDANPVLRFEKFLLQQDWLSEAERTGLAARADEAVSDALRAADAASAREPVIERTRTQSLPGSHGTV
jgi:TPP-dependent pyruvate/acetoin dehydrogenase alpha subunit